ncbi:MAG: hypothetical protein PHI95_06660, partial [Bacteroidales bacterium]|nr:hypothetical protein [Bacteroidales bacterium]
MPSDLTFKQVCEFIKNDDPNLIDAADKLFSLALICTPIIAGTATAAFVPPVIAVKNEIVKISKSVFGTLTTRKDNDYL